MKWEDVDIEQAVLTVRLGNGNKTRRVGLSSVVMAALQKHLEDYPYMESTKHIFLNDMEKAMSRHGLYKRIERIGKKAGVKVSPHALRRAFVTINAQKGKPLPILQRACGHSSIKTTMSYCMTSENEVIEAMKDWD